MMNEKKKGGKCEKCNRTWGRYCQQLQCVEKFGRCLICLARDNPIKDLDFKKVEKYLDDNPIAR